jgi:hypothetical protein
MHRVFGDFPAKNNFTRIVQFGVWSKVQVCGLSRISRTLKMPFASFKPFFDFLGQKLQPVMQGTALDGQQTF